MVVFYHISGVPTRNQNRHAIVIANMSLDLQATTDDLEVPFIAGGKIRLRIGVHSGMFYIYNANEKYKCYIERFNSNSN